MPRSPLSLQRTYSFLLSIFRFTFPLNTPSPVGFRPTWSFSSTTCPHQEAQQLFPFFFQSFGLDNPFLSFLLPAVTSNTANITGVQTWLDQIQLDAQDSYYYYIGSDTTPPCASPVAWHLIDTVYNIGPDQLSGLQGAFSSSAVGSGGNAREPQGEQYSVPYWDASTNAITDPVCGGGFPNWLHHPYDCTDQYDHTVCFYCSGRANGFEAKDVCLNRNGRGCADLYNSPEASAYCNLAFECPASTFSQPFFLVVLTILLALKFW